MNKELLILHHLKKIVVKKKEKRNHYYTWIGKIYFRKWNCFYSNLYE